LRKRNNDTIHTKLDFRLASEQKGRLISFDVGFRDNDDKPFPVSDRDRIQYHYAWGVPGMYPVYADELPAIRSGEVLNENAYCISQVMSSHGPIRELLFDLRIERDWNNPLSQLPMYQHSDGPSYSPAWSEPKQVAAIDEEDHTLLYDSYRIWKKDVIGMFRILWRPPLR
jgi:hypothetical protein